MAASNRRNFHFWPMQSSFDTSSQQENPTVLLTMNRWLATPALMTFSPIVQLHSKILRHRGERDHKSTTQNISNFGQLS